MSNLLFICGANRRRSPTAEQIFADLQGHETRSAGLRNDSDVKVSKDDIIWADIIFAMEQDQARKIRARFQPSLNGKKLLVLDIPDKYEFMQPELIGILQRKVSQFLNARPTSL